MKQTTERLSSLLTCVTAEDRKSFAALVSYIEGLPAGDDFLHFAELLGLLAAVGQRVPTAVGELLVELRAENTATVEYRGQVEERLANLPHEIAEGVNVTEIANGMAVAFRQQFAATGLQSSAGLIRDSSREITALSDKLAATLVPLGDNYTKIAGAIGTELERLTAANRSMAAYNAQLIREQPGNSWQWQGVLLVIMFLLGGLCGVLFEKGQTTEVLSNINRQIERIQTPVAPPVQPDKSRRKGG